MLTYDHGLIDGVKQMFSESGELVEEANYAKGKLEGRFFQKTPDMREVVTHYRNNLKDGLHTIYYPPNQNGEKMKAIETTFESDLIQGLLTEFSDKGVKVAETPYVEGKREGQAKIFAADAHISITIDFLADQKNGPTVEYFPNGAKYRETPYVNDKREGEEKTYHPSGAIASIFNYNSDLLNGLAQSWNEAGVLVFEAEYQNDLRHGKFNKYHEDGTLYLSQNFSCDKLDGEKRKVEKDGSLTVSFYEAGELIKTVR